MRCDAQKMNEKVSDELEVAVWTIRVDLVKLESSLKSAMRSKNRKNLINFF